jgi:hypothetical protein
MHEPVTATRMVEIAALGERLSALRLCEVEALATVRRSLEQHGQLAALTLFAECDELQIIDGFKRVRAARALEEVSPATHGGQPGLRHPLTQALHRPRCATDD